MWWRFRKTWVPGFEKLLEKGITQQWYNDINVADKYACHEIHGGFEPYKVLKTGLFFVGWPYHGSRRKPIRMYTTTTQAAEGRIVARYYQMAFQM